MGLEGTRLGGPMSEGALGVAEQPTTIRPASETDGRDAATTAPDSFAEGDRARGPDIALRPAVGHPLLCREAPSDMEAVSAEDFDSFFECRLREIDGHIEAGRLQDASRLIHETNAAWRSFNSAHREIPQAERRAYLGRLYLARSRIEATYGESRNLWRTYYEARGYDLTGDHARARLRYREIMAMPAPERRTPEILEIGRVTMERRRALELAALDRIRSQMEVVLETRSTRLGENFLVPRNREDLDFFMTNARELIESGRIHTVDEAIAILRGHHRAARSDFEARGVRAGWRVRAWDGMGDASVHGGVLEFIGPQEPFLRRITIGREGGILRNYDASFHFPPSDREIVIEMHGTILNYRDERGRLIHLGPDSPLCRRSASGDLPETVTRHYELNDEGRAVGRIHPESFDAFFNADGGNGGDPIFWAIAGMEMERGMTRLTDPEERRGYLVALGRTIGVREGSFLMGGMLLEEVFAERFERAVEDVFETRASEIRDLREEVNGDYETQDKRDVAFQAGILEMAGERMQEWIADGSLAAADPQAAEAWTIYNDIHDVAGEWFNLSEENVALLTDAVMLLAVTFPVTMGVGLIVESVLGAYLAAGAIGAFLAEGGGLSVRALTLLGRFGPQISTLGARAAPVIARGAITTAVVAPAEAGTQVLQDRVYTGREITSEGFAHTALTFGAFRGMSTVLSAGGEIFGASTVGRRMTAWAEGSLLREGALGAGRLGIHQGAMLTTATGLSYTSDSDAPLEERVGREWFNLTMISLFSVLAPGRYGPRSLAPHEQGALARAGRTLEFSRLGRRSSAVEPVAAETRSLWDSLPANLRQAVLSPLGLFLGTGVGAPFPVTRVGRPVEGPSRVSPEVARRISEDASVFDRSSSLVGQIEGLTPELEAAFEGGGYVGRVEFPDRTVHWLVTPTETRGETREMQDVGPGALRVYREWAARRGFTDLSIDGMGRDFSGTPQMAALRDTAARYGIRIEGDVSPQQADYVRGILETLPEGFLNTTYLRRIVFNGGRRGAASLSAYEDGTVYIYRNILEGSRRDLLGLLLHEMGHSTGARYALTAAENRAGTSLGEIPMQPDASIPEAVRRRMHEDLRTIVGGSGRSNVIFALDWAGGRRARIAYTSETFSEFIAELHLNYVAAGERLRSHIEGIADPAQREAYQRVYGEMRDRVFGGVEYSGGRRADSVDVRPIIAVGEPASIERPTIRPSEDRPTVPPSEEGRTDVDAAPPTVREESPPVRRTAERETAPPPGRGRLVPFDAGRVTALRERIGGLEQHLRDFDRYLEEASSSGLPETYADLEAWATQRGNRRAGTRSFRDFIASIRENLRELAGRVETMDGDLGAAALTRDMGGLVRLEGQIGERGVARLYQLIRSWDGWMAQARGWMRSRSTMRYFDIEAAAVRVQDAYAEAHPEHEVLSSRPTILVSGVEIPAFLRGYEGSSAGRGGEGRADAVETIRVSVPDSDAEARLLWELEMNPDVWVTSVSDGVFGLDFGGGRTALMRMERAPELSVTQRGDIELWLDLQPRDVQEIGLDLPSMDRPVLEDLADHLIANGWNQRQLRDLFSHYGMEAEFDGIMIRRGPEEGRTVTEVP